MFEPLPAQFSFPQAELRVLEFWQKHDIFGKSLEIRRDAPRFVFYEGPPTANGLPHPGHCLTRAIKDLFPRYQTMCGHLVERKAGWDTHGLPVEVEVCKELGIHTKEEIESYGVEKFVQRCIESVFRYTREWEEMTRRLGFWVNLEDAYVTYHQSYVESVWWSLKTLFDRGLLYQGHKIVWWWCQGGTALSAGEVGEGYRAVEDPAVYVRFPLVQKGTGNGERGTGAISGTDPRSLIPDPSKRVSLLVWTTTPWTLISNHFAAVGPDIDYSLVHDQTTDEYLYIATALVSITAEKVKHKLETVAVCKGTDLVGLRYVPPFECYSSPVLARLFDDCDDDLGWRGYLYATERLWDQFAYAAGGARHPLAWCVVRADFVTLDSGTGVVHVAPAFGQEDFELWQELNRELRARTVVLVGENQAPMTAENPLPLFCAVSPNGRFRAPAPMPYRGRWVKDCDAEIMRELKERGVLYHQELYQHEYPFCPRAEDDPLIQYARKSWFVRTSQFKEEFLKNNAAINWLPEHIQEGRFGDFLRNNVDWALSRERYWGTPLPIWVCEKTGRMEAIGSYAELLAKPGVRGTEVWEEAKRANPDLPDHLRVHKPYIDAVTYDSPFDEEGTEARRREGTKGRARMRRVPEVIDCWWDAGSMPFAQWGFPHVPNSIQTFAERFPSDFISEAIDQTRGWFYGLLAISTVLFGSDIADRQDIAPFLSGCGRAEPPRPDEVQRPIVKRVQDPLLAPIVTRPFPIPYRTSIVLGHVMGEDGLKMSKRTKNYREPDYIFEHYGADAMRWFFFSAQTPWTSIRFQEANIRDAQREFLLRLYNVFSFFNIYAKIDDFEGIADCGLRIAEGQTAPLPADNPQSEIRNPQSTGWRPVAQRSELDRWIVSELHRTIRSVRAAMDRFENYPAAGRINEFVDALSNWYVRRSRDRFWRAEKDQDKWDAYGTLYEVLVRLSQLIAPFTPFFAEVMYRNLVAEPAERNGGSVPISVHLCDYPAADAALIDEKLAAEMALVRDIVSLGRAARTEAKLKVRQPLALVEIVLVHKEHAEWLAAHTDLIADELNIQRVEFATEADQYVTYRIKPDFKAIGPKFGPLAPRIAAALAQLDAADARQTLATTGELPLDLGGQRLRLTASEVQIRLEARPGWSAAQGRAGVVVVKTELTPELKQEGLVRELIHHVQALRKEHELPYEARIALYIQGPTELTDVIQRFSDTVRRECLAERVELGAPPQGAARAVKIERYEARLAIVRL